MSSNTPAYSNDFRSSYQRYKSLSNTFTAWLVGTYESVSCSPSATRGAANSGKRSKEASKASPSTSKTTVSDLLNFAHTIVQSPQRHPVPNSILNCLYKIIQRRSEAHFYYSHIPESDASSNDSHAHFIGVLEKIFDTLGGEKWLQEKLDARREQLRKMKSTRSNSSVEGESSETPSAENRFFAFFSSTDTDPLLDEEDDLAEEDEDSWLPDQSSSSDSRPGKGRRPGTRRRRSSAKAKESKKRFKTAFPDLFVGEDDEHEEAMFTRFCFFDDLNMLRGHVRRIWTTWAQNPSLKGLVIAATATDVAVKLVEDLEMRFVGVDPSLAGLDAEAVREALVGFDGMVRSSEDWTISVMDPYHAALAETANGTPTEEDAEDGASLPENSLATEESSTLAVTLAKKHPNPHEYWETFLLSRMSTELSGSSISRVGESALVQLLRGSTTTAASQPRLSVVSESAGTDEATATALPDEAESPISQKDEERTVAVHSTTVLRPCLVFAAQVYLDIDQITLGVDFAYEEAVNELGKRIYTYMNWLSCQNLRNNIKALRHIDSRDVFPIMADVPALRDRGKHASMSLVPEGVWEGGMGDFGRLVGTRITRDVGGDVNRRAIARINPKGDRALSPWSWGSRAMHTLAESLRFGARAYNEGGMFIAVAHIYNAFREAGSKVPVWPQMEAFLAIHGEDIFNGNRPTAAQASESTYEFFFNRWRLRMGLSVHEFSKGKRAGQFSKREKWSSGGGHGCQTANPDVYGPALTLRRPKLSATRNLEGVSRDLLAVKLVEKRMHLDADGLRLLAGPGGSSRSSGQDLGYVVVATENKLSEDMSKMSRNLFAMEAYCQRVIESVLRSVDPAQLRGFLEGCGIVEEGWEDREAWWRIREDLPTVAALVLLLLESYHPLVDAWIQVLESIAEKDEDAGFVLLPDDVDLSSVESGRVEEVE